MAEMSRKDVTHGAGDYHRTAPVHAGPTYATDLSQEEISRYSRQIILPEFRVKGQISLKNTSFLLVGAGGLGCTAAVHLAGSGAGSLTIMDHDRIEVSNLHRQVLYSTQDVGRHKAHILAERCFRLNPSSRPPVAICEILTESNVTDLAKRHDIVLDCTDNVHARYLLNDACVLTGRPLISASALKCDGQLTVYNHNGSPCRRCLFPDPQTLQTQSCDDNGVMGPVPGIMGALQALEAIKLASGMPVSFSGVQLHFSALDGTFYRINLRKRNPKCNLCGDNPIITAVSDDHIGVNTCLYRQPALSPDQALDPSNRISPGDYNEHSARKFDHILVDVRTPAELEICGFRDSLNIPMSELLVNNIHDQEAIRKKILSRKKKSSPTPVIVLCRRGNDSQIAVRALQTILAKDDVSVKDLAGGLYQWKKEIDPNFPIY